MKKLKRTLLASCLLFGTVGIADGQTLSWDITSGDGATITGGAGTWDTTLQNWNNGTGNEAWINGSNVAVFGGSVAGTVTLGTNITAGGLTFNIDGYSIGATGGTNTLTLGSGATINTVTGTSTINSPLAGTTGFTKTGNGVLALGVNSTLSGSIVINGGELRAVLPNSTPAGVSTRLGTASVTANTGTTLRLMVSGSSTSSYTYNNAINLNGATLAHEDANHILTGNVALTGSNTVTGRWGGKNMTISGVVSGAGSLIKTNSSGENTLLTLTGNNTFTGGVFIRGSNFAAANVGRGIRVSTIGNGGVAGNLGAATNAASNLVFGQVGSTAGQLEYVGTGESTNRLFTIDGNAIIINNGTGALNFTNTGTIAHPTAGGHTLTLSGTNTNVSSIASVIADGSSPISVNKSGVGTWALTGANTYTGATAVQAGTLRITGSNTSAITVNSGAFLNGSNTGSTTGLLTMNAGSTLLVDSTGAFTTNGANFVGGSMVMTSMVAGTIYDVLNYGAGIVTTPGNFTAKSRGTLTNDIANSKFTFTAGAAGTRTWNTTNGTWDNMTATNFVEGDQMFSTGDAVVFNNPAAASTVTLAGPINPGSISVNNTNNYTFSGTGSIGGSGSLTKAGTGLLNIATSNSYTGGTTINGGELRVSATTVATQGNYSGLGTGTVTANAGTTLRFFTGSTANAMTYGNAINLNDATLAHEDGNHILTGNIALTGSNTITGVWGDKNLTLSGVISGAGSLIKTNTAGQATVLSLTRQNTYTGGTTINAGTVSLDGGGGAAGTLRGVVTVNTGGTLRLNTGDATGFATDATRVSTINLNGGTLNVNTIANQTLGSAVINMTGGAITGVANSNLDFFGGASSLNTLAAATTSSISGVKINMRQNNGLTLNVADGAAANDLTISSVISNAGGFTNNTLTKTGSGTLLLSGVNTYVGGTIVNGGTLDLAIGGGAGAIREALTVNSGATARVSVANGLGNAQNTRVGNTTLNGGTLDIQNTGNNSITSALITMTGGTITGISGSKLDLRNNGVGNTNVTTNASSTTSVINVGTLGLPTNNATFTVASGTTSSGIDLLVSSSIVNNAGTGGLGAGASNLSKAGSGTLLLSGANTYTGTTSMTGGTLIVNGVHTGGAAYSVDGTLKGTGSIGSAVSVNSGGTLSPGASVESLSMGALTMSSGSTFIFEGDSLATEQADLLRVNGNLSLSGVTLNMVGLDSIWSPTAKFTLISYGGTAISGGFTGFLDDTDYNFGGSNLWRLDYNDTVAGTNFVSEATAPHSPAGTQFVTITAVPEPSSLIFATTMIGCFLYRRRKPCGIS